MKKLPLIGLALASVLALSTERAFAHSVQTDYLLSDDDGLALDVTFSSGEPVADAPVKVYAPDNLNEPWLEGTTDENGQFNFSPDQGREGEWTVEIGELSHADILSVPVEKEGIQIDDISHAQDQAVFAQAPLSLKTLPAQAITTDTQRSDFFGYGEIFVLGAAVFGGSLAIRRVTKK